MVRIAGEIVINRPVEEVFDFVADARNEPRYNSLLRRAEQTTPGPIGPGTRFRTGPRLEQRNWTNLKRFLEQQPPLPQATPSAPDHGTGGVRTGSRAARIALFGVDAFAAVTAVGGGIALATGAEGDRFPDAWLRGTPFHSYVVPGLILAGTVGGSATAAAAATLCRPRTGGRVSLVAGGIMIGWIAGEACLLKRPLSRGTLWEAFYFAVGLLMAVLGLRVGRAEETERREKPTAGPSGNVVAGHRRGREGGAPWSSNERRNPKPPSRQPRRPRRSNPGAPARPEPTSIREGMRRSRAPAVPLRR